MTLRDADADLKYFAIPATTNGTGVNGYGNDVYYYDKSAVRAARRGGYFDGYGGVFSLHLSHAPLDAVYYVGFRACKAL